MRRASTILAAILMTLAWAPAPLALGHGGVYVGPTIPPPPAAPPPSAPGGARAGGRPLPRFNPNATRSIDERQWETWWAFNKEDFFPSRGVLRFRDAEGSYEKEGARPPSEKEIREKIVPALMAALKDKDREIRNSAAIALGKVGDVRDFKVLAGLIDDRERTVAEAACLGLGLLRCDRAEKLLLEVARDRGRWARQRGMAVLGLGYSGGDMARGVLLKGLGKESGAFGARSRAADLESLRALAAGLLDRHDLQSEKVIAGAEAAGHLMAAAKSSGVREKSFIPMTFVGLAKVRDPASAKIVLAGLKHPKSEVRAAAATALGRVVRNPDKKTEKRIISRYVAERDQYAKRMMLLAMGRIGTEGMLRRVTRELDNKDRQHRSFAVLACAMAGLNELVPSFRQGMQRGRDDSSKAAYAIALGILRDHESAPLILDQLKKHKNPRLQAHLVQALLMLGDAQLSEDLEQVLIKTRILDLQATTALALGLIGNFNSSKTLISVLKEAGPTTVKGAAATGLGRMGDSRLIDPLITFIKNESEQDIARAFGCIALGILAEKDPSIPPFARLSIDSQYEIRMETLEEVRDIL